LDTYFATYSLNIVALLFLLGLLINNNILNDHRKKPFIYGIVLTILVIFSEAGTILCSDGNIGLRGLNILFNVLGFALTPVIPIVLLAIFDGISLKKHLYLLLPTVLNIVAVVLSPLFGLIFYVDISNHYERGSIFALFVAVYIINIIILVIGTLRMCRKFLYPIKSKIIALSLFTVAGTCIQLLVPSVYTSWHCVTLSLFLYYILLSEFDGSFDTLTNLYNRAAFENAVKKLKGRKMFCIVVMDIDDFKKLNDTFGHDYGDIVLKRVAEIIQNSFDNECTCYRIGGDEFCIVCRDAKRKTVEKQLKCLTDNLTRERANDRRLPTVAYGYSFFQSGKNSDFLKQLKEADDQMYRFKQLRKNNSLPTDIQPGDQ